MGSPTPGPARWPQRIARLPLGRMSARAGHRHGDDRHPAWMASTAAPFLNGRSIPSALRVPSAKNRTLTRSRTGRSPPPRAGVLSDSLPSRSTGMLPARRIAAPKTGILNSSRLATNRVCFADVREDEQRVEVRLVVADEDDVALGQVFSSPRRVLRVAPAAAEHRAAPGADQAGSARSRPSAARATTSACDRSRPVRPAAADVRRTPSGGARDHTNSWAGKRSTSVDALRRPSSSIRTRSSPTAMPAEGGIRPTASRKRSSSGYTGRPGPPCAAPAPPPAGARCSAASVSSEKPLASSEPVRVQLDALGHRRVPGLQPRRARPSRRGTR